jgi:hypothetical protein
MMEKYQLFRFILLGEKRLLLMSSLNSQQSHTLILLLLSKQL